MDKQTLLQLLQNLDIDDIVFFELDYNANGFDKEDVQTIKYEK